MPRPMDRRWSWIALSGVALSFASLGCASGDVKHPIAVPEGFDLDSTEDETNEEAWKDLGCEETGDEDGSLRPCIDDQVVEEVLRDGAPARVRSEVDEAANGSRDDQEESSTSRERSWWVRLGDQELARLIEAALSDNPQLRSGRARVQASRKLVRVKRAGQWPTIDAELSAQRSRQVANFPDDLFGGAVGSGGPQQGIDAPDAFQTELYSAQLSASWQPDFWGVVGSDAKATEASARAAEAELGGVRRSLAQETAAAYFDLVASDERRQVMMDQLAASRSRLSLVETMYEQGLSDALALERQRESVAAALTRLASVVGARRAARARLAVLLGRAPKEVDVNEARVLPPPPPRPPMELPAKVIESRPEVQAARERLDASRQRLNSAGRERLPKLRLQGSIGRGGNEPRRAFDEWIWSAMATLRQPLFHGGRINAQAAQRRAQREEALAELARVVVEALTEVEVALADSSRAHARRTTLEERMEIAKTNLAHAELRYTRGLTDFLTLLDAERSLYSTELQLVKARRSELAAWVALESALHSPPSGADEDRSAAKEGSP